MTHINIDQFQFDCASVDSCQNIGPYFGGLDEASCKAQGGKFCRFEDECTELHECIDEYTFEAQEEELHAFENYLNGAQNMTECGKIRSYFGFDEFFIHDESICENIEQLKYSKDFTFLNEFFGQGSDSGAQAEQMEEVEPPEALDETAATVEPFLLEEVNRGKFFLGSNVTLWRPRVATP